MSYSWPMFIIKTELNVAPVLLEKNDNEESPPDQFPVSQDHELDWFDLTGVNVEIITGAGRSSVNVVVLEGNKEDRNTAGESVNVDNKMNVPNQENNADDLESDLSKDEFKFDNEDEWDAGLDGYEFSDDSG